MEIEQIEIQRIERDGGTQPRARLNDRTVDEYTESMKRGDVFPPVVLYYDGKRYWLADGFHRVAAASHLQSNPTIAAHIRQGTHRDAIVASVGANASHGLRRTADDKRRAVARLLNDDEWGTWSDREIAKRCHVSHTFVSKQRAAVTGNVASDRTYTTKHGTVATMKVSKKKTAVSYVPVSKIETAVYRFTDQFKDKQTMYTFTLPTLAKRTTGSSYWVELTDRINGSWRVDDVIQAINNVAEQFRKDCETTDGLDLLTEEELDDLLSVPGIADVSPPEPITTNEPPVAKVETTTAVTINTNGQQSSIPLDNSKNDRDEWYTPEWLTILARKVMGGIDVDPASCATANEVVQASLYFAANTSANGLQTNWIAGTNGPNIIPGRVWLNPPYSHPLIEQFTGRLLEQIEKGFVSEAMLLTNNNTETAWWHAIAAKASAILFFRSRVFFWRPDQDKTSSPRQGQTLFYFGSNTKKFKKVFSNKGIVYYPN